MRKFIFITLLCALVVFGCEDKSDTHTHEWGEWQYNETEHWKECTANDGAEYGRANHTGDPCTVCGYETPKPHESTITAFGKTAKVTGDASISTADFATVKGKLQTVMTMADSGTTDPTVRGSFTNMLDHTGFAIIIETGNAGPTANANKSMTIGVNYVLNNDINTIGQAIWSKIVDDNAFAD